MDTIWAPWRIEYIRESDTGGCFLCAALQSDDDADRLVLARSAHTFVIMNRYPYNNGHLMVVPHRHEGDIEALDDAVLAELMRETVRAKRALRRAMQPDGFNVGINLGRIAGAGLEEHLHVHIVPRWAADTNFMPVVADTKVVPQALKALYAELKPLFDETEVTDAGH